VQDLSELQLDFALPLHPAATALLVLNATNTANMISALYRFFNIIEFSPGYLKGNICVSNSRLKAVAAYHRANLYLTLVYLVYLRVGDYGKQKAVLRIRRKGMRIVLRLLF